MSSKTGLALMRAIVKFLEQPLGRGATKTQLVDAMKKALNASAADVVDALEALRTPRARDRKIVTRSGRMHFVGTVTPERAPRKRPQKVNRVLFPAPSGVTLANVRDALSATFVELLDGPRDALRVGSVEPGFPGLVIRRKKAATLREVEAPALRAKANACFELGFDDRAAVLFEMNTLIEVQATITRLTGMPAFNVWNGKRIEPPTDSKPRAAAKARTTPGGPRARLLVRRRRARE